MSKWSPRIEEVLVPFGREPWRDDALCAQYPYDMDRFFRDDKASVAAAKATCAACPVREPCLDYATANEDPWGVWGGLTPKERQAVVDKQAS